MAGFLEQIKEELRRTEREEDVRIVYACEAGSRAWGLASEDSDYDVRFIYVRPVEWYLSIFEKRDVIERPLSKRLDLHGWDLKKALNLFRKSNPPLLEWLQSPIRYAQCYGIVEKLQQLTPSTFSPRSGMYHYWNMAKRNYRAYLQGMQAIASGGPADTNSSYISIKKCFNVLRPVLACRWIEQTGTVAPVELERLVETQLPGPEPKQQVYELIRYKKGGEALGGVQQLDIPSMQRAAAGISEYLEREIAELEQAAAHAPEAPEPQDEKLDALFREALHEVWELPSSYV